jgi:methylglutaconyl-CoA hydratase
LLTGRILGAEEARALGLVNEIVSPPELMNRARALAAQLMENSPQSLRATKTLLSGFTREQLDRQIAQAIRESAAVRQTEDFQEGVSAFLEKRKPAWRNS